MFTARCRTYTGSRGQRLTNLLVDEDVVGGVDEAVDADDLVPAGLAVVVLLDEDEHHHGLHHELAVLGLRDAVQHHLHLQRELLLPSRHLNNKQSRETPHSVHAMTLRPGIGPE